jgi:hypothetical protein
MPEPIGTVNRKCEKIQIILLRVTVSLQGHEGHKITSQYGHEEKTGSTVD